MILTVFFVIHQLASFRQFLIWR